MVSEQKYFEDFNVGDAFESERYTLTREESLAFARSYDPQPFHLDDAAAEKSFFGRLVASGWQTAAISMRLIVGSGTFSGGIVGAGVEELRWTLPVAPGDTLRVRGEVIGRAASPGGKRRGIVRFRMETFNQDDTVVMTQITNCVAPMRPAQP
ncbi:MAG TPA: MaoC/PaaZ C-terminal domain-containing protein [Candidatus Lustribacter sp.]